MKQQFLDLKGLTELVGYLKDSIANKKVILPYASSTLFPSVGDINSVYIDTSTNSIYRWDSSNKKYEILAKAVKSVSISESTENGKITLTVDGTKTTVPIHGLKSAAYTESSAYATAAQGAKAESAVQSVSLASGTNNGTVKITVNGKTTDNIAVKGLGSAAYTASSAYATSGHTHTKAQIGLGNVDNTADKDKSVKHATTADNATTAGSATTATNVSGENATGDTARHVWFSRSDSETKRVYNDNFKYNPATNLLTTNITGSAASANSVAWTGVTGKPTSYPPSSHTHAYLPLSGGTMTGALNFANGTWNVVGDDVAIGDMNVGGTLGVMGKNGNTAIKLVQYGASTTSGSAAPGVSWTCTGANASTISGTLSGTFSGNLSGNASKATLLAPAYTADTFSTASSTWRAGVTEGKVVWGQSWKDTSMSNDTGDLTIWIKKNGSVTTANMTIDGTITAGIGFIGSLSGNASSATALTSSAGSATQPIYFSGGKPVACTYTLGKSVPADAKFTDTNTWRGIQNNLTSTATDQSLAAAQGKVLNEKKMGAVSANGYYGMARPDNNTSDWIRTTTNGLLPVQSGGRGSGHSALGTDSWYFSKAYVDHVYSTDVKIADKVILQYDSTNTCLNFVFL